MLTPRRSIRPDDEDDDKAQTNWDYMAESHRNPKGKMPRFVVRMGCVGKDCMPCAMRMRAGAPKLSAWELRCGLPAVLVCDWRKSRGLRS